MNPRVRSPLQTSNNPFSCEKTKTIYNLISNPADTIHTSKTESICGNIFLCAWKANNGYATINWRYQGKKLISFPSRKYIFHKNREISILTMKKKQQS
jgi:hypothetical protein